MTSTPNPCPTCGGRLVNEAALGGSTITHVDPETDRRCNAAQARREFVCTRCDATFIECEADVDRDPETDRSICAECASAIMDDATSSTWGGGTR